MLDAKISIIIPTLNEASNISQTLLLAQKGINIELIVVDGGSQDRTVAIVKSLEIKILSTPPGRATQMNAGAAVATGDILLFLHGDTFLPAGFDRIIRQTLFNYPTPNPVAGAFELAINTEITGIRLLEKIVNWRSRFFSLPYGDQAIFLKTDVFRHLGGFPEMPIMEDFVFIRNLKKLGKITIVNVPVITSGRRWQKLGIFKTTWINQMMIMGYFLGISPKKLVRFYRRK